MRRNEWKFGPVQTLMARQCIYLFQTLICVLLSPEINEFSFQTNELAKNNHKPTNISNWFCPCSNNLLLFLILRITELVSIHEQLKKQEKLFEHHINEELKRLSASIDSLRSQTLEGQDEHYLDFQKFQQQRSLDEQKFTRARNLLAKKTREIASLQRKLDDCPSRAELAQYQRRFVELHKQVSATLTETRQYFTLYNTLNDTQIFLDKESQLLNILYDKFATAMTSNSNKDIYFKHLDQFLDETKCNFERLESKKNTKKRAKDLLNDSLLFFLDQQRQYSKLVRDFGTQIRRNEELNDLLRTS